MCLKLENENDIWLQFILIIYIHMQDKMVMSCLDLNREGMHAIPLVYPPKKPASDKIGQTILCFLSYGLRSPLGWEFQSPREHIFTKIATSAHCSTRITNIERGNAVLCTLFQ